MMRTPTTMILALAMVLALAPDVEAQSARRTPGLWVSLGVGGGSGGFTCQDCSDNESRLGPLGSIALGWTLTPRIGLSAEVTGWGVTVGHVGDHFGFLTGNLSVFPFASNGLYLMAGAGLSRYTSDVRRGDRDGQRDRLSGSGLGWRVGAGYDIPIGTEVTVAPFVAYLRSAGTTLQSGSQSLGVEVDQRLIQIGAALYWNFTAPLSFPRPTH